MNDESSIEMQLEELGAALRQRPSVAGRVLSQVRNLPSQDQVTLPQPAPRITRRRLFATAASIAVAIAAAVLVLPTFPSVSWAQVADALRAKTWIRGQITYANGNKGTLWISPERRIWAQNIDPSVSYFDGKEQVKYEYRGGDGPITKLPLGEEDAQRVLPLDAVALDQDSIGPWLFGSEKIVKQERREVKEGGASWIEFHLTMARGEMNQAVLRVDPKTKLPAYVLFTSPHNKEKVTKFEFDYPAEGPADIYAAGVKPEIAIVDRMPSKLALKVLREMAASRAKIGDFRLIVGHTMHHVGATEVCPGSVVSRKGDRWRVDRCAPPVKARPEQPAAGEDWGEWAEGQLATSQVAPLFVFDGKTIWENSNFAPDDKPNWAVADHVTPQDLMSGEGLGVLRRAYYAKFASLLYPDLTPKQGWTFEVIEAPAEAPGCILVKRSASLATAVPTDGHEWYYVDPAFGHAVVRAELFSAAAGVPATPESALSRQSLQLENFQMSPDKWWYCTLVRNTKFPRPGMGRPNLVTARYSFDFKAALPDSLFSVDKK